MADDSKDLTINVRTVADPSGLATITQGAQNAAGAVQQMAETTSASMAKATDSVKDLSETIQTTEWRMERLQKAKSELGEGQSSKGLDAGISDLTAQLDKQKKALKELTDAKEEAAKAQKKLNEENDKANSKLIETNDGMQLGARRGLAMAAAFGSMTTAMAEGDTASSALNKALMTTAAVMATSGPVGMAIAALIALFSGITKEMEKTKKKADELEFKKSEESAKHAAKALEEYIKELEKIQDLDSKKLQAQVDDLHTKWEKAEKAAKSYYDYLARAENATLSSDLTDLESRKIQQLRGAKSPEEKKQIEEDFGDYAEQMKDDSAVAQAFIKEREAKSRMERARNREEQARQVTQSAFDLYHQYEEVPRDEMENLNHSTMVGPDGKPVGILSDQQIDVKRQHELEAKDSLSPGLWDMIQHPYSEKSSLYGLNMKDDEVEKLRQYRENPGQFRTPEQERELANLMARSTENEEKIKTGDVTWETAKKNTGDQVAQQEIARAEAAAKEARKSAAEALNPDGKSGMIDKLSIDEAKAHEEAEQAQKDYNIAHLNTVTQEGNRLNHDEARQDRREQEEKDRAAAENKAAADQDKKDIEEGTKEVKKQFNAIESSIKSSKIQLADGGRAALQEVEQLKQVLDSNPTRAALDKVVEELGKMNDGIAAQGSALGSMGSQLAATIGASVERIKDIETRMKDLEDRVNAQR